MSEDRILNFPHRDRFVTLFATNNVMCGGCRSFIPAADRCQYNYSACKDSQSIACGAFRIRKDLKEKFEAHFKKWMYQLPEQYFGNDK